MMIFATGEDNTIGPSETYAEGGSGAQMSGFGHQERDMEPGLKKQVTD
jgi:hypothetical protein